MKLPSGIKVKDETLSEIADWIALDMLSIEGSYNDSATVVAGDLENGWEGEHETLPGLDDADRKYILDMLLRPTIDYLLRLRKAREKLSKYLDRQIEKELERIGKITKDDGKQSLFVQENRGG